ncbi:MAG: sugar ABC transporter permease [Roseburia sp.]|nr:sugar ABC transporter permease [Roseburia sp.]
MLMPVTAFFLINNYLPMVGIYFAFTDFNFRDGLFGSPFVGLKNFEFLWKSNILWRLTRNTILYNIVFILLGNVCQAFMAILVSLLSCKRFKKITQTMIFMPYFTSYVILSVVVYNLFNYENGLINGIVTNMGHEPINFYGTPAYWPFLITFFHIWKGLGYGMVVYLATILGISNELHEAAIVDGANILQRIKYIIIPHIKPTFIILLLYAIGGIMRGQFQLFYQIVGNNGLLFETTDIIDTYVYRVSTTSMEFGMGTAAGLYQSVFGLVLVVTVNWLIKRKDDELALF